MENIIYELFEESNLLDTKLKFFELKVEVEILRKYIQNSNLMWANLWSPSFHMANYLINNKKILKNKNILDYGCGNGIIGCLAKQLGAKTVHSYDIDIYARKMCQITSDLNDQNLDVLHVDPLKANNKYDIILMSDMLCYSDIRKNIKKYKKDVDCLMLFSDFNRRKEVFDFVEHVESYQNIFKDKSGPSFDSCSIYKIT